MLLATLEFASIMLAALVMAMFLGPWLALTRTADRLEPAAFVPVVHQLSPNMARTMTVLMPISLLVLVSVMLMTFGRGLAFWAHLIAFVLFLGALVVTTAIEVPLVRQMETWDLSAMPPGWQGVRDRWRSFHILRVVSGLVGLGVLVAATVAG